MNIYQCQNKAKDLHFDGAKFEALFPAGIFTCQWLDAYLGLFKVDADGLRDGFLMVHQIDELFPHLLCCNLRHGDEGTQDE